MNNKTWNGEKGNTKNLKGLIADEELSNLAIALTHFIFRNGPVEEMHSKHKLTDTDMMLLNKTMVNRLAYVFYLLLNDKEKYGELIEMAWSMSEKNWDTAVLDDVDFEEIYKARKSHSKYDMRK